MSSVWLGVGSIVLGAATNLIGANKQAGAIEDANNANLAAQAGQNQNAWNNYLLTRGIYGGGNTPTSQIPTNPTAVNAKLPLWATVNVSNGPKRWVKTGTVAPATTLALSAPMGTPPGGAAGTTDGFASRAIAPPRAAASGGYGGNLYLPVGS